MKNILTKSISSPGRIIDDQFPNRFPRIKSNRGSRSRTNPMFVGKPNTNNEVNQEPSSPKVTCMGQVRMKRSIKRKQVQTKKIAPGTNWLQKPRGWLRKNSVLFFRSGCCGKSKKLQGQNEIENNEWRIREIEDVIGNENDVIGETEGVPKNAFLLTRSRSEPFRCSAFANKLWEPNVDDETGEKVQGKEEEGFIINGDIGKENGEDIIVNRVEEEEFKEKPLILNRCKSEPARTGDKLFMSFTP